MADDTPLEELRDKAIDLSYLEFYGDFDVSVVAPDTLEVSDSCVSENQAEDRLSQAYGLLEILPEEGPSRVWGTTTVDKIDKGIISLKKSGLSKRGIAALEEFRRQAGRPPAPPAEPTMPSDELILFRDGESVRLLAYRRGNGERYGIAKSTMDGVNWKDSKLAMGAMFDPGTDAVPITVEEARELHPNLVLPE